MNKITTILFDVDGTLLDTTELIYQAFEYAFATNGDTIPPRSEYQKVVGKPLFECYRILTGKIEVDSYTDAHHVFQLDNMQLSKPFTNSVATLQAIKKNGLHIAAVTSRKKKSTSLTLDQAGISPFLDFAVFADEVTYHKPHPEALQKAMMYFNAPSENTIMVGDTEADVLGGKNAGVKTIGALYGFRGESLKESEPDFLINDISEVIRILAETS